MLADVDAVTMWRRVVTTTNGAALDMRPALCDGVADRSAGPVDEE